MLESIRDSSVNQLCHWHSRFRVRPSNLLPPVQIEGTAGRVGIECVFKVTSGLQGFAGERRRVTRFQPSEVRMRCGQRRSTTANARSSLLAVTVVVLGIAGAPGTGWGRATPAKAISAAATVPAGTVLYVRLQSHL